MWNYYRDEPNPPLNNDDPPTVNYNEDPIKNSESFKYKSSIKGKTSNANQENGENAEQNNTKTKKLLFRLTNVWRTSDMPLINCEVSLTLAWSENCVLNDITTQAARAAQGYNPAKLAIKSPRNATFKLTGTKLYVPVVTLSAEDDKNFLVRLKSGFKRTIK